MQQAMNQIFEIRANTASPVRHLCLAIVCVIGSKTSTDTNEHAMRCANDLPGVDDARPAHGAVNAIVVHYNRKYTSGSQIAERLRRAGHNVVLVSF